MKVKLKLKSVIETTKWNWNQKVKLKLQSEIETKKWNWNQKVKLKLKKSEIETKEVKLKSNWI